ncbi:MAG: hypothetical protein ACUVQM_06910 [Candidatus Hadarchaeaceae archaeon]
MSWTGPWPGRGPFSHLPPWERPSWLYGPGACWRLYAPLPYVPEIKPVAETEQLQAYVKELEQELESVRARIKQLEEAGGEK